MIVFDMRCENGHVFEAWFKDSSNFQEQHENGVLKCPMCGTTGVKKILSRVNLKRRQAPDGTDPQEAVTMLLRGIYDNIVKNSEDVGISFASEALKMHYGVTKQRSIRGVATEEEEKMLRNEGVEFFRIPVPQKTAKKGD